MIGNVALDVFIGLVFIFLLYSLLASIIMEEVAKFLGLRPRILLKAISKLLDDSEFKKKEYFDRAYLQLLETKYFNMHKGRPFTALFYSHPDIKNLGRNTFNSKPTYISDELFAETLIQILRGDDFKGEQNQISLIRSNLNIGETREGKLKLPNFYLYGGKYRLIKESDKVKETGSRAGQDPPAELLSIHPQTLYQLKQMLFDAHQDIDWFKVRVKKWYNEMVERSEGWYTKQTRFILVILGFVIAWIFNVDTIEIANRLSRDETLRNKVIEIAANYSRNNPNSAFKAEVDSTLKDAVAEIRNVNNILSVDGNRSLLNVPGWIITAFALSLGASFWFDLFKKIMAIRQAGDKPQETAPKKVNRLTTSFEEPVG
jgi:hypothetical protein